MDVLKFKYVQGKREVFPAHPLVSNWLFKDDQEDEAFLANSLATIAHKNGISSNHLYHLFPAILRMLKSDIEWAK